MNFHELSFGNIILLREDIAEVVINHGVVMDMKIIEQYHEFLLSNLKAPFSLLINKLNAYTYSPDAQEKLATLKEINVMAVVSYNQITQTTTEMLVSVPRQEDWNLKIFHNRSSALSWIESEQDKLITDLTRNYLMSDNPF